MNSLFARTNIQLPAKLRTLGHVIITFDMFGENIASRNIFIVGENSDTAIILKHFKWLPIAEPKFQAPISFH